MNAAQFEPTIGALKTRHPFFHPAFLGIKRREHLQIHETEKPAQRQRHGRLPGGIVIGWNDNVAEQYTRAGPHHRRDILQDLNNVLIGPVVEDRLDEECICRHCLGCKEVMRTERDTRLELGCANEFMEGPFGLWKILNDEAQFGVLLGE